MIFPPGILTDRPCTKLAAFSACAQERGREIEIFATGAKVYGAGTGRAGLGRTGLEKLAREYLWWVKCE